MEVELSSGVVADLFPVIGALRGVVLIPDLEGRSPVFTNLASGLASAHTWNVIVVDPLEGEIELDRDRFGGRPEVPTDRVELISRLDDDQVVADLVEAANRLEAEPVAAIGFGSGGMYAMKAAASDRFDRVVSFYGPVHPPDRWKGKNVRDPLALLTHVDRPGDVLAVVGTEDPLTPSSDIDELISLGVRVARYERATAGFAHLPEARKLRPRDAADAWAQVISHLAVDEHDFMAF